MSVENTTEQRMYAYHNHWGYADLMKARGSGIDIDGGDLWHFRCTRKDGQGDEYDEWFRPLRAAEPDAGPTDRDLMQRYKMALEAIVATANSTNPAGLRVIAHTALNSEDPQ